MSTWFIDGQFPVPGPSIIALTIKTTIRANDMTIFLAPADPFLDTHAVLCETVNSKYPFAISLQTRNAICPCDDKRSILVSLIILSRFLIFSSVHRSVCHFPVFGGL